MIVGNAPMIKPIISRYNAQWKSSRSAARKAQQNKSKSVGSDSSSSVETGSRSQNSHHDVELQSCDDGDSTRQIVGKADGLEISTNKTYEVTYETSGAERVVLQERVHSQNMAYGAQAHIPSNKI